MPHVVGFGVSGESGVIAEPHSFSRLVPVGTGFGNIRAGDTRAGGHAAGKDKEGGRGRGRGHGRKEEGTRWVGRWEGGRGGRGKEGSGLV